MDLAQGDAQPTFCAKKSLTNKSNKCCCALGCKSYSKRNPDLSFHLLPKEGTIIEVIIKRHVVEKVDRRLVWMKRLKISEQTKQPYIFSLHFCKDNYRELSKYFKNKLLSNLILIILLFYNLISCRNTTFNSTFKKRSSSFNKSAT